MLNSAQDCCLVDMSVVKQRALNEAEKASVLSDVTNNKHKKDCFANRLCQFLSGPVCPAASTDEPETGKADAAFIEALSDVDGASELIGAKVAVRAASGFEIANAVQTACIGLNPNPP